MGFGSIYGVAVSSPLVKGREELREEIIDKFRMMRDSRRRKDAFRELTEEDVLQAFREVLVEEVLES